MPLHHLIVIDRNSRDGTIETIKHIFPDAIIEQSTARLGWARKTSADLVDTPLFAFVDEDVEIPKEWFSLLMPKLTEQVGAIHALAFPVAPPRVIMKWDAWESRREGNGGKPSFEAYFDVTSENYKSFRGYTHNTIVRTKLLKDWRPPKDVSCYEDWLLLRHVTSKGYKWRVVRKYIVAHRRPDSMKEHYERTKWSAAGARFTGYSNPTLVKYLKQLILQPPNALLASIAYRDPQVLLYLMHRDFNQLRGYLDWEKNLDFNRGGLH